MRKSSRHGQVFGGTALEPQKIKIVLVGQRVSREKVPKLIDPDRVEIVGTLPKPPESDIGQGTYTYAVVIDGSTDSVENSSVIDLSWFLRTCTDFEIFQAFVRCLRAPEGVKGLVTGMSNAAVGVDTTVLRDHFINLAASSQDLYFDYEVAKFALSMARIRATVQFAIVGLHYISFQYDLSLSALRHRVLAYYPFVRKIHNYADEDRLIPRFLDFEQKSIQILREDYLALAYDSTKKHYTKVWADRMQGQIGPAEIDAAEAIVARANAKDYPNTVVENRQILGDYLQFLVSLEIRPVIVICPMSRHYRTRFSPRIREEFQSIVDSLQTTYPVDVLDYFDSGLFEDSDFYDIMHLNRAGSKKLTNMLNAHLFHGGAPRADG